MMKASLAACFVLALGAATAAAGNSAPAAPAAPASTPAAPSAAALGYAATILNDVGMKPSLDRVVPAMLGQLQREVLATRPELKDPLDAALKTVLPEFVQSEQAVLDDAAKVLAGEMTEPELKDVAAFYESPLGKKFIAAQGVVANHVAGVAGPWRQRLSTDILARVHEEMKKSGHDF
jgi:hypothetical protein